jgi:hypothetical protein
MKVKLETILSVFLLDKESLLIEYTVKPLYNEHQ